jgi:hypothetical protein
MLVAVNQLRRQRPMPGEVPDLGNGPEFSDEERCAVRLVLKLDER